MYTKGELYVSLAQALNIKISINIEVNSMKVVNTLFKTQSFVLLINIIFTRIAIDPNKIIRLQRNILNIDLKLEK